MSTTVRQPLEGHTTPHEVRGAVQADAVPLINHVGALFMEEALQPVSPDKVKTLVYRCINREGAIAGIIEGPLGIEASIGLALDQFAYSESDHLAVKWLGVGNFFRKANHASKLIRFAKWASETMHVPLHLGFTTASGLEKKLEAFQRHLPQSGAYFAWGFLPSQKFFNQPQVGYVRDMKRHPRSYRPSAKSSPQSTPAD